MPTTRTGRSADAAVLASVALLLVDGVVAVTSVVEDRANDESCAIIAAVEARDALPTTVPSVVAEEPAAAAADVVADGGKYPATSIE
jgi:hypothetical protein